MWELSSGVTRKRSSNPVLTGLWLEMTVVWGRYRMTEPVWAPVIIKHYRTEYGAAKHWLSMSGMTALILTLSSPPRLPWSSVQFSEIS